MAFQYDLFVSYARESEEIARRAYKHAKAKQRVYFFPEVDHALDGKGDDVVEDALRTAISNSREMLVLLDANHLAAEWCGWEVEEFRRSHGANAVVYYQAIDFSEPTHHPPLTPWRMDGDQPSAQDDRGRPLLSLVIDPPSWGRLQGHSSGSFRLFDRWRPACRGKVERETMLRRGCGAAFLLAMSLVILVECALHLQHVPSTLRQLALVGALCFGAGIITAILQDVPVALLATVGGLWGSIAVTVLHARVNRAEWDPWIAGGSAAGIFLGLAMGGRLTQRAANTPRRWSWATNAWTSHRRELVNLTARGVLSVFMVLVVFRELFSRARLTELMPAGTAGTDLAALLYRDSGVARYLSAPMIAGLAVGSFLFWISRRSHALRAAKVPAAWPLVWFVLPVMLGAGIGAAFELSIGTNVGVLAGAVAAISVGRSRLQTQRARLSLKAAWPASLGVFAAFIVIGWWSTSGYQPVVSSSAEYGLTMGLLVALILGTAYCFHGAIWGRGERAGNDGLLGGIATLCLLPVLGHTLGARTRFEWVEQLLAPPHLELPPRIYATFYLSVGASLAVHTILRSWLTATRVLKHCVSLSAGLHLTLAFSALPAFHACGGVGEGGATGGQKGSGGRGQHQGSPVDETSPPSPKEGLPDIPHKATPDKPGRKSKASKGNWKPPVGPGATAASLAFKDLPQMDVSQWPEIEKDPPPGMMQLSFEVVRSVEERLKDVQPAIVQTDKKKRVACGAVQHIEQLIAGLTEEERTFAPEHVNDLERQLARAEEACRRAKEAKKTLAKIEKAIRASPLGDGHADARKAAEEAARSAARAAADGKDAQERAGRDRVAAKDDVGRKRAERNARRRGLRDGFGGMGYRGTVTRRGAEIEICPGCRVIFTIKVDAGDPVSLSTQGAESDIKVTTTALEQSSRATGEKFKLELGKEFRPNLGGWSLTNSPIHFGFEDRTDNDYNEPELTLTVEDRWRDDDPCTPTSIGDRKDPGCSQ